MNKKILLKLLGSCIFTFLLALLFLLLCGSKIYRILELKTLDLRFVLRGNQQAEVPILHIDIDDQSLAKLGRWPWPRSYHAKLIDTLVECGARQVLFDVLFTEKLQDRPQDDALFKDAIERSARTYLPFYFEQDNKPPSGKLEALLLKDITVSAEDAAAKLKMDLNLIKEALPSAKKYVIDEVVRDEFRKNPELSIEELLKILEDSRGWFLFPAEESYIRENFQSQKLAALFVNKFSISYQTSLLKEYRKLTVPITEYAQSIKGSGYINAEPDEDGVMRRAPLFLKYENKVFPQLAVAALLDFLSVKEIQIKSGSIILKSAHIRREIKDISIPIDDDGLMLINWTAKWGSSFAHTPYHYIWRLQETRDELRKQLQLDAASQDKKNISGQDAAAVKYLEDAEKQIKGELENLVKDKICLVGLTGTGTQDMGPIPLETDYPYVGVSSNLANTIIAQNFITRGRVALNVFIFFFTALILGFCSLMKLWRSVLVSFLYAVGYFLAAFLLFSKAGLWIDVVGPESIIVFGFSAITSFRYFTEEKEKLWIKQAFSHYLSKEVINELMNDPSKLKLGGERKNLSVIFSDVRGFTKFSESHQPEEVVAMLNEILTEQVGVVFKYNGTLDKFVGDELMAFFGAPGEIHLTDHALVAVRTAIDIQLKLKEIQQKWVKEKKDPLQIGIGINTGDMVVGNMGSSERMDYTVIGDNVNLAARLCSAASGDEIIISGMTYEKVKDQIQVEKLEPILVKGKAQPIPIYKVIGLL